MSAEAIDSGARWRITIRLIDSSGQPAAGVEATFVVLPPSESVTVEPPPPTDEGGYAVGYVSSTTTGCVTIEVHAGGVVLREKPLVCFP